jgi:hypothetical protein
MKRLSSPTAEGLLSSFAHLCGVVVCVCLLKAFHLEVHGEDKSPSYLSLRCVCVFDTHGGTDNIVVLAKKQQA